jgi:hypothetical protein
VIIGFGLQDVSDKTIYEYENTKGESHAILAKNINPYLVDAPNILLTNNSRPICKVDEINYGSFALDDGNYTLSAEETHQLISEFPDAKQFIRPFIGGQELIRGEPRFCIWLLDAAPQQIKAIPIILEKVRLVQKWRQNSQRKNTQDLASTPAVFAEIRQPKNNYLALPTVSSERRAFIPIGFLDKNTIASNQLYIIPNANLFHFGVMTSTMHMAWVRAVCGRLESRYRYSAGIVYNNFPWPEPNDKLLANIETGAQTVLNARAEHINASLADLYDPLTMPVNLLKAHQMLDKAVDAAYGYKGEITDAARVAFLFERYQQITSFLPLDKAKKSKRKVN